MTMRPFASTRVVASAALIALVAGMAGGLAACDTRSSSDRAIEKASNEIYGLTGGGTVAAPNSSTKQSMESVIAGVQDATNDESKSRAAAAQLLTAQAQLALGEQPAAEAMALDRETRGGFDRAVGLLSSWSALNAGASAAESFDPSSTIADLTKSIEAKRGETQEQRAQLTRINEQIAKLERERQGFLKTAEDLQSQYASQMDAIRGQSAMSSAQAVEKAQEVWRKAEKARLDAARLTAQIEVLGPEAQSRQMVAEQTERQIEDLTNAIEELRTQRQARTQAANQSRDDAQKVAATLDQSVFDASKRLTDEVIPAYDKAIGVFGKAASASQAAEGASPAAGRVSTGAARQSIAELNWMKAQALAYQGRVLGALSKAQPSLPNASDYANRAKASMDGAKEALTAANQAFTQAQSAFAGAPAQAASRERLQKLGELLGKAAEITEGKALDLGSSFGFQSISTPPERDRVAEVRPTIDSFNAMVREGRFDEAMQNVTGDQATIDQYREMLSGIGGVMSRLDAAIQAKFPGKTASDAMGPLAQMGLNPDSLRGVEDVATMTFKDNGDGTVSASSPESSTELLLKEVNGQWKIDIDALKPKLDGVRPMVDALTGIFGELATEIEEGKYDSIDAVNAAVGAKFMGAAARMRGG